MPDYQAYESRDDGRLVEIPAWFIGLLIARHEDECAVRADLRRTAGQHAHSASERLQSARTASCTCGSFERQTLTIGQGTLARLRRNHDEGTQQAS